MTGKAGDTTRCSMILVWAASQSRRQSGDKRGSREVTTKTGLSIRHSQSLENAAFGVECRDFSVCGASRSLRATKITDEIRLRVMDPEDKCQQKRTGDHSSVLTPSQEWNARRCRTDDWKCLYVYPVWRVLRKSVPSQSQKRTRSPLRPTKCRSALADTSIPKTWRGTRSQRTKM